MIRELINNNATMFVGMDELRSLHKKIKNLAQKDDRNLAKSLLKEMNELMTDCGEK